MQNPKPKRVVLAPPTKLFKLAPNLERVVFMRTNIELDDQLLQQVHDARHSSIHKPVIQAAVGNDTNTRKRHDTRKRRALLALRGRVAWQGELAVLRSSCTVALRSSLTVGLRSSRSVALRSSRTVALHSSCSVALHSSCSVALRSTAA